MSLKDEPKGERMLSLFSCRKAAPVWSPPHPHPFPNTTGVRGLAPVALPHLVHKGLSFQTNLNSRMPMPSSAKPSMSSIPILTLFQISRGSGGWPPWRYINSCTEACDANPTSARS